MKRLQDELTRYIETELSDFLGYDPNTDDVDGIVENTLKDINERVDEYIETIERND